MSHRTLSDADLSGKRVLIRVDLNVPTDGDRVTDDTRIQRILPTVEAVIEAGGKPILLATELAVADPTNAAPATVRKTGRLCYPSANRAVTALGHAWERSRWLQARGLS